MDIMSKIGDITFPDAIEPRSFFSDIALQNKEFLVTYNQYMQSKQYQGASAYAEATGHEYFGAYLFNAYEGRIQNIGTYELEQGENTIRPFYQDEKPDEDWENLTWISSTEIVEDV